MRVMNPLSLKPQTAPALVCKGVKAVFQTQEMFGAFKPLRSRN
jgi:hypothetical protein